MNITKLIVKKLFGRFDYEIDFSNKKLLIITAPNGYGKSTILKIIKSFVDSDYIYFINENFQSIDFYLSNGLVVNLEKFIHYNKDGIISERSDFEDFVVKDYREIIRISCGLDNFIIESNSYEGQIDRFERMLPVTRLDRDHWMDDRNNEVYSFNEMINRFKDSRLIKEGLELPAWLIDITTQLSIEYISTNRLSTDLILSRRGRSENYNKLMVDIIAKEIKDEIDKEIKKQFNEGRKRETSFPTRLMQSLEENEQVQESDIKNLITQIQDYESQYLNLDIVPDTGSTKQLGAGRFVSNTDESASAGRIVLKTYLNDVIEKFKLLDELAKKLTLFSSSINNLMSFKRLSISSESGFVIKTYKADPNKYDYIVPLSSLSSGEQHLLVLIGKLIFTQKNSGLVLIDEPEISLHPEWQETLLDILSSIQKISNFGILVATHSPSLIGDRWDDVIELRDQVEV